MNPFLNEQANKELEELREEVSLAPFLYTINEEYSNLPENLLEFTFPWQYRDYKRYTKQHVGNVRKGYNWLKKNLPQLFADKSKFQNDSLKTMQRTIRNHDKSKYSKEEMPAYDAHFYHKDKEKPGEFQKAWNHHQKFNKHHWQYWLITKFDGSTEALDMPEENIIEMICDWWAFSWAKDNLYEIFNFYRDNKSKMILSKATRAELERILSMMKKKIDEKEAEKKKEDSKDKK